MIRLFAAVPVPAEIGEALAHAQTGIEGARWRPPEALHITLRFFGEIPEDRAEDLDVELSALAGDPMGLTLQGAGAFGEGERLRAVWAGVADNAALRRLAARCESAARRTGLKPETRNYLPHVTLAYLNRPNPVEVAAWVVTHNLLKCETFAASAFHLCSSRLGPSGSSYRTERVYRLA